MVARQYSLLLAAALACAAVTADAGEWTSLEQSQQIQSQTASAPSAAGTAAPRSTAPVSPAPVSNNAMQVLYGQIEQLQQEVQTLRGLVEEQGSELNRLKNEQKERYLELDRRLSQILNQGQSQGSSAPAAANDAGDAAQYDAAFALVRDKRYPDAVKAFSAFVSKYPKSSYTPNAYYWLGQVYYAQDELDEARKAFSMVINQFADNQKVPESRFKLGVILHRLGQADKAKALLQSVVKDYAKSAPSISRLADTYLRENLK